MADEPVENERPEDNLYDQLRLSLHSEIDAIFGGGETGLDVYWQLFAFAGRLLKQATSAIDLLVAYELLRRGASADTEVSLAGERARNEVSEMLRGLGGRTAQSTVSRTQGWDTRPT